MRKLRRTRKTFNRIVIGAMTTMVAGGTAGIIGTSLTNSLVYAEETVNENVVDVTTDVVTDDTDISTDSSDNNDKDAEQQEANDVSKTVDTTSEETQNKSEVDEAEDNDVTENEKQDENTTLESTENKTDASEKVLSSVSDVSVQESTAAPVVKSISFNKSVLDVGDEIDVTVEMQNSNNINDISLNFADEDVIKNWGYDDSSKRIVGFINESDNRWKKTLRIYNEYFKYRDNNQATFVLTDVSVNGEKADTLFDVGTIKFTVNNKDVAENSPVIKSLKFDKEIAQPGDIVKIIAALENDTGKVENFVVSVGDWGFIGGEPIDFTNGTVDEGADLILLRKENNGNYSASWDTSYLKKRDEANGWYKFQSASLYYDNGASVYRDLNSNYSENWIYIGSEADKKKDVRTSTLSLNVGDDYNISEIVKESARKYMNDVVSPVYGGIDTPDLLTEFGFTCISGNTGIATVDNNGNLKAISPGKTKIQVVGNGNYGIAVIELEVKNNAAADYSQVEEAKRLIPSEAELSKYTDESVEALKAALSMVVEGKSIDEQDLVDEYARAINVAVMNLKLKENSTNNSGESTSAGTQNSFGTSAKANAASPSSAIIRTAANTGSNTKITTAAATGDTNHMPVIAISSAGAVAVAATAVIKKRKREN